MKQLIERKIVESRQATVFGYVRGNALEFGRILKGFLPDKRQVIKMKKRQSGDFHVPGTTMFKIVGDRDLIDDAIGRASKSGMFEIVKEYMGWVPGYLEF